MTKCQDIAALGLNGLVPEDPRNAPNGPRTPLAEPTFNNVVPDSREDRKVLFFPRPICGHGRHGPCKIAGLLRTVWRS